MRLKAAVRLRQLDRPTKLHRVTYSSMWVLPPYVVVSCGRKMFHGQYQRHYISKLDKRDGAFCRSCWRGR